jgi:serine/threonine protein phosphatase PrpC
VKYYQFSNKGGRERNEDYVSCFADTDGEKNTGFFILADGLGGHGHGEVASELVARSMMDGLKSLKINKRIIDAGAVFVVMQSANALLLKAQEDPRYRKMKSTAALLCVQGDNIICAHIGDSRLYYFSGGAVRFITADHSVSYKKYLQGQMSYEDIGSDEDRSSLLRVMGNSERFEPEINILPAAGGAFLLCCDGFWEYVKKDEMLADLLKSENPREWTEYMLLRHIARAEKRNDNFSSVAVFLD